MTAADPPGPAVVEHFFSDGGARLRCEWFDPPWLPPAADCLQAYAIAFTGGGEIVLVNDPSGWNLPGGSVEEGEDLLATLAREVDEEACARVVEARYIGCQRISGGGRRAEPYYEARFWARVELDPFVPRFETTERALVPPERFLATLGWGHAPTAALILERGLACERTRQASIT